MAPHHIYEHKNTKGAWPKPEAKHFVTFCSLADAPNERSCLQSPLRTLLGSATMSYHCVLSQLPNKVCSRQKLQRCQLYPEPTG